VQHLSGVSDQCVFDTCFRHYFSATKTTTLSKNDSISDKEAPPFAVLQERKLDIF
jgi:hypothetical protein